MKRFILALCLTVAPLAACTPTDSPSNISQTTVVDEKVAVGAELLYQTATRTGLALTNAGLMDKTKFKAAEAEAYAALLIVRDAYKAANASRFDAAIIQLYAAVGKINALVK